MLEHHTDEPPETGAQTTAAAPAKTVALASARSMSPIATTSVLVLLQDSP